LPDRNCIGGRGMGAHDLTVVVLGQGSGNVFVGNFSAVRLMQGEKSLGR